MLARTLIIVIGFALSVGSARAADAKAEIDFVTRASNGNRAALAESRLALDRSGAPQVKAFAQRLIEEHGTAEAALETAAEGSGATVPTAPSEDQQARIAALQSKSGAAFDRAYVADQAEIHSNALTLYADYMLLGDNGKLKALAVRMIPVAEAQFKVAQALSGD